MEVFIPRQADGTEGGTERREGVVRSQDSVHLTPEQALALGKDALCGLGYAPSEAAKIMEQLLDNALCGYDSAGLPRILAIATAERRKAATRSPVIVSETENTAIIDGGNTIGYLTADMAATIAIDKATAHGLSLTGVHNSWYSGRAAYFVERIVRAGLVAIHSVSAPPRVAPYGGTSAVLGTNPIAFGFPSEDGPVIFDMGTAAMMWGDILQSARRGDELPEGVALDSAGRPTRDAEAAARGTVLPFAGYKGFGLAFAIQALGLLAGAAVPRKTPLDYGFLFIACDPERILPGGDFKRSLSDLVRRLKETPTQPGASEIRIPSERAFRERAKRRRHGLEIDRDIYRRLLALRADRS